jgi:hypothetical protein
MANLNLRFYNKQGDPLNLEYVGPTASAPLDTSFIFRTNSQNSSPLQGYISLLDLSSNLIYMNLLDGSGFNITSWCNNVNSSINNGAKVSIVFTFDPAQNLSCVISGITISGGVATLSLNSYLGPVSISNDVVMYCQTRYQNLPGGYFSGTVYFNEVSAGLYENDQIFIVQEFIDTVSNDAFLGYPHTGSTGGTGSPAWRTRWDNNTYGNVDVTDIIFTYQIEENDPDISGDPAIINYQNIAIPIIQNASDYVQEGFVYTPETETPSRALQINVALNSSDAAAEIYERKLIVDDITSGTPEKILELQFYGQIIGEDERLNVLTQNLGRAFYGTDSVILKDHDPGEIFPNYVEINEKRKELMIAGEDIFPYIGSYKGLIGALKFFGYQDLRIKEYWLNLNYNKVTLQPLQENQAFLDNYLNTPFPNQQIAIADVLDNENSGKYRLEQTYGPNDQGEYVLNVSSENTLVPSRTYKKTALFGLYYDIVNTTDTVDPYGYPVTQETFAFTQEEVLLKLFALKERLKQSYLPLNARIVDITGEGVYFNVYNTKEWTDFLDRSDVESGNNIEFIANPDFGFIEDLRAFGVRDSTTSIQAPMNYFDVVDVYVSVAGPSGDAFVFAGSTGDLVQNFSATGGNPTIQLSRGKQYNFNLITAGYDLYFTTQPGFTQIDPLGIENNGASSGTVILNVNPQEQDQIYYYSSINTASLNGSADVFNSPVSDLGNTIPPLFNNQQYTVGQNSSLITSISNFYSLKENGLIKNLGDGLQDPVAYVDPITGQTYENPVGMPIVLELVSDRWVWDNLGQNWDTLELPSFTSQQAALTWGTIDFSAYNEIEWIIEKSQTQTGSGYYFSTRGFAVDFYKLAHFLPYTGEYNVTCLLYDSFNFINRKIVKSAIQVAPKQINIDAWTRYRENEIYLWDQTIRSWEDYQSIWEYPAEGKTFSQVSSQIPKEILDFAVYGNNSIQGQTLQVKADSSAVGASGNIVLNQKIIDIEKAYSLYISGSQYGNLIVFTQEEHGFISGSQVYLSGMMPEINSSWGIVIPPGSTGYSFEIPYVLGLTAGVGATSGAGSIAGATAYYVIPSYYPNQTVTGGGSISVSVGGRVIGATTSGSNLQATVNSIIQEINSFVTQPDYFAQSYGPDSVPAIVNIVADVNTGNIGNDNSLTALVTGSLEIISIDPTLTGGSTGTNSYVDWNPATDGFPVESLKYYGTKNLTWDTFNESIWDDTYAHGWYDFEYQSGWLGGFEIHSSKVGDNIKVSTGNETFPFPTGVTFSATGGITGPSGYITLGAVAEQLNSSDDPNITNFYYRVIPSDSGDLLTTNGPVSPVFNSFPVNAGSYAVPDTVPGAPSVLLVSFTYATGP